MKIRIFIAICFLVTLSISAHSAEIYFSGEAPYTYLRFEGEIVKGDYQKIVKLIEKHGFAPDSLFFDSPGGDVMEAMKIGRLGRRYLMLFSSKQCDSACVFVFIGSIRGWVDPWGKFGLHRPRFDKSYFSNLTAEAANEKYKQLRSKVELYLTEMGAPQVFIDKIFSIPSKSAEYISSEKMINILGRYPVAYQEWVGAKCGTLSDHELDDLGTLATKNHNFSEGYIKYLESTRDQISNCAREARQMERKRLIDSQ